MGGPSLKNGATLPTQGGSEKLFEDGEGIPTSYNANNMACDGHISREGLRAAALPEPSRISFRSDGYYWFLFPFFEAVKGETGQMVDLYDDADFHGEALLNLLAKMKAARESVLMQPSAWEVAIGEQLHPVRKKLHAHVTRVEFLALLDRFTQIIQEAITTHQHLVFIGD